MKILIVNKFYYPRGGDCVVAMNTQKLLERNGHTVRVYAMSHPQNVPTADIESYASNVDFSSGISGKMKAIMRVFGKGDIVKSFSKVLTEFNPDVVHLHNIHSYLSPIVAELAHKHGARVVWTLHDYKLLCPSYSCRLPNGDNCEQCIAGRLSVVKNRCMKGSLMQSAVADLEARYWNRKRLELATDVFVAPSEFMRGKMLKGGFMPDKFATICNFVDPVKVDTFLKKGVTSKRENSFCYIGRLSEEKGVATMIKAAVIAGVVLNIAGDGPLKENLEKEYAGNGNIRFLGHLSADKTAELLLSSKASVMPSECYDNNPLGVIESLCAGTPVIGANIGGIPELIADNSGRTFESGNTDILAQRLREFNADDYDNIEISKVSINRFSLERHYEKLMAVYNG